MFLFGVRHKRSTDTVRTIELSSDQKTKNLEHSLNIMFLIGNTQTVEIIWTGILGGSEAHALANPFGNDFFLDEELNKTETIRKYGFSQKHKENRNHYEMKIWGSETSYWYHLNNILVLEPEAHKKHHRAFLNINEHKYWSEEQKVETMWACSVSGKWDHLNIILVWYQKHKRSTDTVRTFSLFSNRNTATIVINWTWSFIWYQKHKHDSRDHLDMICSGDQNHSNIDTIRI